MHLSFSALTLTFAVPCREVAQDLKVNLCVYDYSGYGCSTGTPSVANTIADIDACYSWLLKKSISPSDIILYGQSIGSGPTINLAARSLKVSGVVLHAAFAGHPRAYTFWLLQSGSNALDILCQEVTAFLHHFPFAKALDVHHTIPFRFG